MTDKPDMIKPPMEAPKSSDWDGWQKRVLIAVPTTGSVRIEWMMARFGQVIPCNWSNGDIFQYFNQYSPIGWAVADARNVCVEHFISQGFEWILFIDHDVILPPDTFLKMNEYMRNGDIPVVSGLYFCKGTMPEPLMYRGRGTSYYGDWKRGDKVWVDGIPMGCTLIHKNIMKVLYENSETYTQSTIRGPVVTRKVFETPRQAWQDPETGKYKTKTGTEDLFWCDRVMKEGVFEKAGFPDYEGKEFPFLVDTSIFCQHVDNNGVQYPANVGVR